MAKNASIAASFLKKNMTDHPGYISNCLEIGCNYGYNLDYLSKELGIKCYGIERSDKAVQFGRERWKMGERISLECGVSSHLPYEDNSFDVVMIGFFLYITPREILSRSIFEADRVLKTGGFLVLTDFDTPVSYRRVNRHNSEMFVYKEDYGLRFQSMGYSLAEKHSYSHGGDGFHLDVQERLSIQIFYKEPISNHYVDA